MLTSCHMLMSSSTFPPDPSTVHVPSGLGEERAVQPEGLRQHLPCSRRVHHRDDAALPVRLLRLGRRVAELADPVGRDGNLCGREQ